MAQDIAFASAAKLAGLIRRKKIGCLELLDHYLARVEKYNPVLNAIITTDIPAARKRAKEADRALSGNKKSRKQPLGKLHGVPMTVKEAFDVKGLKTSWGVPEFRNNVATRDATAVERFNAAGAVIFGKTNVPMWLADGQSFNAIYGATKNPWNLGRTPGGSSGGSSAALAAGLTGIEIGSDIASSIRNPAHHCGVFGHKPTFGICPPRGHNLGARQVAADDINVIGPLARSADDLDLGLSVMAGPDDIEAGAYKLALPPPRHKNLRDFRIGVMASHPDFEVDHGVQDLIQKLADFLAKKKAKVSDTARPDIDIRRVPQAYGVLLRAATSARQTDAVFAANLAAARALSPGDTSHNARMLRGNTLPHRDWLMLDEERQRMRWKWHEYFKDYDLLLCPAFPAAAHPHMHDTPTYQRTTIVNGKQVPYVDFIFWAGFAGMSYLPASVAPIGFTAEKLPVGVQVIGPYGGDRTTIHFAKLLEKEYQGFVPPPGYE